MSWGVYDYPEPPEEPETPPKICPRCHCECETLYFDMDGQFFACDQCVKVKDAWED